MMFEENLIEELIEARWYALESDCDEGAFLPWRRRAYLCPGDLLGRDRVYVHHLRDYVRQAEKRVALAGEVILNAAREEILKKSSTKEVKDFAIL
jgi:hypothetical protein